MRIGSLFSGIGGLELGLEWAGVGHTVWQVEQDPYCLSVLAHHWPDAQRFTDVRDVGAHNLAPVDVICGGFPCQDISYAGKGAGLAGARSGLWTEFARIVGEMGPQYVVVENVRALLTRGIDQVLGTLADLGYDAEWSTLRASDVGAPHRRERVFIVAYRESDGRPRCGTARGGDRDMGHASGKGLSLRGVLHAVRGNPQGADEGQVDVVASPRVGHANNAGPQRLAGHGNNGHQPRRVETSTQRPAPASGVPVGWSAVPVRGCDGTVRLIPREAAEAGPESPLRGLVNGVSDNLAGRDGAGEVTPWPTVDVRAHHAQGASHNEASKSTQIALAAQRFGGSISGALWPVAYSAPGRVARLRALGNAVVPACAEIVGRRLLEIASL